MNAYVRIPDWLLAESTDPSVRYHGGVEEHEDEYDLLAEGVMRNG